jgi:anthranilate synthase component 1
MPRYFPDFATFSRLAQSHDVIPVYRQLLADRLTPPSAFQILSDAPHAFLLESVVGGENVARHSFIATNPTLTYQCKDGQARIEDIHTSDHRNFATTDPLKDLATLLPPRRYAKDPNLPPFTGGLVGYASYDTIRYYEGEKLTAPPPDDRHLPDLLFGLYAELIIFDHVDKTIKVVANADLPPTTDRGPRTPDQIRHAYDDACKRTDSLVTRLNHAPTLSLGEIDPKSPVTLPFQSNFTKQQFESAVAAGQEYIKAGDIFQFVPSQRLRVTSTADPFDVYRALRIVNPSPFMFYLKTPDCTLIGASPEILCRVQNRKATTRPLAGTRRRGATPEEDLALEKELLADPKERAEHIMLVDLHRNDIGRVSQVGSVVVSDCMTIERYSHVMHITTNVTGTLADEFSSLDALRVSHPVGTVSGAPKIRAMQIIDELEPTRRGPYGGAVGYLDFAGDMDTCIALRTIVCTPSHAPPGSHTYDVQSGAGVVADSVPSSEYEETMAKAKAMLKAVEIAQAGF